MKREPMRGSRPTTRIISCTSAPAASQIFAIELTKLKRVARKALAACLVSSAVMMSVTITGAPKTAYNSASRRRTAGSVAPIKMRSGLKKSRTALPSRRNSGFDATCTSRRPMMPASRAAVPAGTVDRVTTIAPGRSAAAAVCTTDSTNDKSAEPSSPCGVGTQTNTMEAVETAATRSPEKLRRRVRSPVRTSSCKFGSCNSTCPEASRPSFSTFVSTHTTS
ncbi:MAG: hypothetical protein RL574_311 [Actinomycetota bacterium]|jgi:hypothetical protein